MKIKKCSCKHCRLGLRSPSASKAVTLAVRAARHKAKRDLKAGKEQEVVVSVSYTD